MDTTDANSDLRIRTPIELFDCFIRASDLSETITVFKQLCGSLDINPRNYKTIYQSLKNGLTSWKARSLWTKLDKRVEHKDYTGKPCSKNKVLVIGAGPCGLRVAIEAALLGAHVAVLEKRDSFSRNNVLHLWPYLITDLKNLGAKKFFGQFCAGSLDHISIKRLQLILLKVSLIFGVQVHHKVAFGSLVEPKNGHGWKAVIDPPSSPLNKYEFDIIVGADGRRQALKFKGKEFRGKLAIGITANFVNRNSKEEAQVEEISGVAFIFNQGFFQDLKDMTGIDLENIVYYKDETHYFVMCAKKQSLLAKGVIKKDLADAYDLLHPKNVNHDRLLTYAREAAEFSTKFQMPHMDFAINHQGKEDVAMFDFTSLFAAEHSIKIYERKGKKLLAVVVGDSLLEPFWPTGSGCARGFLGCFDAAWAMKGFGQGKKPLDVITERENIYRILAQTTPENLNKNFDNYGLHPDSRYTNYAKHVVKASQVKHLYDCHEGPIDDVDGPEPMDTTAAIEPPEVNLNIVLKWCQEQTKGYKNVKIQDMSASWKDGLAFCAIIHRFRPDLIDFASLDPKDVEKNNQLAFEVAEGHLGILPQISAKEMASSSDPDQLTMLSYVTQYYETFKNETPVEKKKKKEDNEKQEYKTTSPLSKLSIISRMSRKKEKRKSDNSGASVVPKKIKQSSKENIEPTPPPKTPERPVPIEVEAEKDEAVTLRTKPAAKTSNRISLLAEQVFGAKDGTNVVPNLPRDTGSEHCYFCNRWVYLMERMSAEGLFFHRECFKCEVCLNTLRLGAYSFIPPWEADDEQGHFYCRPHYYKVINSSRAEDEKLRQASQSKKNQKKRRGKSLTISNPQETRAAVREAAKRIKNQAEEKKRLEVDAMSPVVNGEIEVKKVEKPIETENDMPASKEDHDQQPSLNRNRPNSGRFYQLEARPIRRSSISSTRKSDKTVRSKAKGYKLDGCLLDVDEESGSKSPIRVPSPNKAMFNDHSPNQPQEPGTSVGKKKPEKSDSAEEAIQGSMKPSGLDKIHRLGTVERKRRQRRAMYPPLSQVFSPEEQNRELASGEKNGQEDSIEASLRKTGMNVKIVDINIDDNAKTSDKKKVSEKQQETATAKEPEKTTGDSKQPVISKSPPGSLVSLRAARIRGLMDNDIRPKNLKGYDRQTSDEEKITGQESPTQQRRALPRVPSNEEPYTSTMQSTKIAKRRPTPKPKTNVQHLVREFNGVQEDIDETAKALGFEVVGFNDIPSPYRKAPAKPPRSFKREEDERNMFSGSSEEDILNNDQSGSFQRTGARRYKNKAISDSVEEKEKRHEQDKIRIAMKQRHSKRLRQAQHIQRELQEVEVKQAQVEKDGVHVEKALRSGDLSPHQEQQYMMQWFQIINRKNVLLRYESELVIHGNSIQLEDQQGRLEQEIRELLMKEGATEKDQVIIQQKTKELVDIVEQRNNLVELLDEERKREQEEDKAFEEMMAAKGNLGRGVLPPRQSKFRKTVRSFRARTRRAVTVAVPCRSSLTR